MYNEEQKERFLASATESENVRNVYRLIFKQTEKTEEKLGKDVCEMAPEDEGVLKMAAGLISLRGESKDKRLYLLKQYVRWCVREGVPGASDAFLEVQPAWFGRIREKMVGSPMDLLRHLNEAFEPADKESVDIVCRCFLWLGFMGVDEDDAIGLRISDIDPGSHKVFVDPESGWKVYPIPDEAMKDFTLCHDLDCFLRYNDVYSSPASVPRASSSQFLRGVKSEVTRDYMAHAVYIRQKRKRDEDPSIRLVSYTSLRASGHFYRMYELERAGVKPDFGHIIAADMEKARERRTEELTTAERNKRMFSKKKAYSEDYKCWKYVFGF